MTEIPLSGKGHKAIDAAVKAARLSGKEIKARFNDRKNVQVKSKNNFVSQLDLLSERIIIDTLGSEFPDWPVISEESTPKGTSEGYTWITDPIDGTTNSITGIPFIGINIALLNKGEVELGVTYDPLRNEMFTCVKGKGAFLNKERIRVSRAVALKNALIGSDLGYVPEKGKETLEIYNKLWWSVLTMRLLGSAALGMAYVACGRFGLYFHRSLYPWDIASGLLMVREAGGDVVDWSGKKSNYRSPGIIASNRTLSGKFLDFVGPRYRS
jgi:myo-inositol-1(or 4)-monophosphatase